MYLLSIFLPRPLRLHWNPVCKICMKTVVSSYSLMLSPSIARTSRHLRMSGWGRVLNSPMYRCASILARNQLALAQQGDASTHRQHTFISCACYADFASFEWNINPLQFGQFVERFMMTFLGDPAFFTLFISLIDHCYSAFSSQR